MTARMDNRFAAVKAEGRPALVTPFAPREQVEPVPPLASLNLNRDERLAAERSAA